MALPVGISTVTVTGTLLALDGTPATGSIDFTPSVTVLYVGPKVVALPAVIKAYLAAGVFTVVLPAADDAAANPENWTIHVVERCDGGSSYDVLILAANGSTQDLSTLHPVASGPPPIDQIIDGGVL